MVDHYFSGAAYVNCSYVYEYLGSYDNNYHAGRGTKTYRITCIGETVTISETQLNLNPGEKHRLTFVRKNSHGTPVWTSSNTNVATVNESGTVTAVKSGHAVITLDPIVGEPRFCDVTVIQIDPESMSLEPESITVKAGDKSRFTCIFKPSGASSDVTWTSSNESVATVNSSGVITGVSEGSAQITAASENGLTAVGTVEVVPLPEQVMLPSALGSIFTGILLAISRVVGETAPLMFTALGGAAISWNVTKPMSAVPLLIWEFFNDPNLQSLIWGASLFLLTFVLLLNLLAKRIAKKWKI